MAILTYFIGALIYALPVPLQGLKRWAPRLISDGIYASVLINSFLGIVFLSNQIASQLGASWSDFFGWTSSVVNLEFNVFAAIRTIYALVSLGGTPALDILLAPLSFFSSLLTGTIASIETLVIIGEIIESNYPILLALGVALFSIPFRVGRSVGSGLIASSTVFYIGLPYLPKFIGGILGSPLPSFNQLLQTHDPLNFVNLMAQTVIPDILSVTLFLPAVYVIILAGLSAGLSTALGGSSTRLPFPIDIL
ncbi:hypothetical protein HS1genome_0320 [Sulfodiicoccus acidiphilus]|uniref:Uncharacterized protein n=1 Tax=Sulfodiicoccus acidiphilus TaxID=1670455 RepID=A0A348B179_9CREN|nr:DNA import protein CedA [Sulfodiicoccus acidiphilus]BBD71931.1 hypothetical protein HS1genome_0320 [Sulfodiicoccus acidiphilus]GGT91550.1 hypothetical protein GCM10007116_06580 [Sulfodiicoccus acidiphilus]